MIFDIGKIVFAALFFFPLSAWSTTINRCEDDNGRLTFTTLSCPVGHSRAQQQADNAPPGSIAPTAPSPADTQKRTLSPDRVVVVGQRDDGCGNILSADQRRRATFNLQTPAGMTRRDVENMLGKPDQVTIRGQETRYVYLDKTKKKEKKHKNGKQNNKDRNSREVTFDENDCVKGKR